MFDYSTAAMAALFLSTSAVAEFTVIPQLFQVSGGSDVNNVKLTWSGVNGSTSYTVSSNDAVIANVTGNTYDDYDLAADQAFTYKITAYSDDTELDVSSEVDVAPYTPSGSYSTYDNTQASQLNVTSDLQVDGTYYRFLQTESDDDGNFDIVQQQSTDGYNYDSSSDFTVLTSKTVCESTGGACKLERTQFMYNPSTSQFVMWAHFENAKDYTLGQVAVAHGAPGEEFTFDGAYQPLGHDSRDMSVFTDDDGSAYLISSTNTNTDTNIYSLTSNWTAVDSLLTSALQSEYREASSVVKVNGTYFLFTSRASGWYPSTPQYNTATSMSGPWSEALPIGNTATFASQSGGVSQIGSQYVMQSDRWSENWDPSLPPNRQLLLPVSFSGNGYAQYHFYKSVCYSEDGVFGVQSGKALSPGKTCTSSGGSNVTFATDGTQDDAEQFFEPDDIPFWLEVDLADSHTISQVDLTTLMVQGSEMYYSYNITGSTDGSSYTLLADESNNTVVGFVPSLIDDTNQYRYIRVNFETATNSQNGDQASWFLGVHELLVYGQ